MAQSVQAEHGDVLEWTFPNDDMASVLRRFYIVDRGFTGPPDHPAGPVAGLPQLDGHRAEPNKTAILGVSSQAYPDVLRGKHLLGISVQAAGQPVVLDAIYGTSTDTTIKNYRRRQPVVRPQFQGIAESNGGVGDR